MGHFVYGLDFEWIPFINNYIVRDNFPKVVNTLLQMNPKAIIGFINDRSQTPERIFPLKEVVFPAVKKKKQKQSKVINTDILYQVANPYAGKVLS